MLCLAQSAPDTVQKSIVKDSMAQKKFVRDTTHKSHFITPVDEDSLAYALRPHPYQPNPKKAGLYSAILPGLGQAYNHQYWKVPVIYVGLAIAGYFISDNLKQYQKFRKAWIYDSNIPNYKDEFHNIYTPSQLKQYQDDYNKNFDLSILFTGVGYFLQVVDAITSAHLKNFDISRDISMHMKPVATPNGAGLGLVMNFK